MKSSGHRGSDSGGVGEYVVRFSDNGLELDSDASRYFGTGTSIAKAALSELGRKLASPRISATLGEWLWREWSWHEAQAGDSRSRWIVFCEGGACVDVSLHETAVLKVEVEEAPVAMRSLRHEVRNFVNAVQVNAELIALHGEKLGEARIAELIGRIKRSCSSLGKVLDEQRSSADWRCDVITGLSGLLRRSGVQNIRIVGDHAATATAQWCVSAAHLALEWLALDQAGAGSSQPAARDRAVDLAVDTEREAVRFSIDGLEPDRDESSDAGFSLLDDVDSAAPDLVVPAARAMLMASGIGFGMHRERDAAALYVAMP